MSECDICGESPATTKIRLDSSVLNVCSRCAAVGTVVNEPKLQHSSSTPVSILNPPIKGSEEIVVPDFGKLIAQGRLKSGLKQEELALKLNEKLPVIQAAESGKRLEIKLAKKLEKFFGIKLVEIV